MHLCAGERLNLTLSGAGSRAMVSLNAFAVTQPAIEGSDPSEDGFTYDVTPWLTTGSNVLTVVLFGPPGPRPFQLIGVGDGTAPWTLDEADFLPSTAPWRLWTQQIELRAPALQPVLTQSTVVRIPR